MAEIELTYELALEFLSFLRVQAHTEPGDLNLLCLQGMRPDPDRPNVLVLNDNVPDAWVGEAQRLLKYKGCPELLVDGDWRTQMDHVVRKFQTEHNLTVDGWMGPETWKALTA